jgi:hypothetical protein
VIIHLSKMEIYEDAGGTMARRPRQAIFGSMLLASSDAFLCPVARLECLGPYGRS